MLQRTNLPFPAFAERFVTSTSSFARPYKKMLGWLQEWHMNIGSAKRNVIVMLTVQVEDLDWDKTEMFM